MRQADRLIVNILSNYGLMAVEVLGSLLVLPIVVRHLGREGFGLASMVLTVQGVFDVIAVSLGRTLQRFIPQALATGDNVRVNRVFNTTFAGFIILGLIGAITTWALDDWLLQGAEVNAGLARDAHRAFWILLFWLGLGFPASIYSRALEAVQRYDLVAAYTTAAAIIRSVGLIAVFLSGYGSITLFVLIQFVASCVILVGCRKALRGQIHGLAESPRMVTWRDAASLARFTSGTLLMLVGNLCITQGFRLFVGKGLGFGELGALATVFTLTNLMWRLIYSMASTLTPAVSSMQAAGQDDSVRQVFQSGCKYCLVVASSFCLVPLPVIAPLFGLWLGDEFKGLDALLLVALLSQIPTTLGTTPQLILMGLGKVHVSGLIMLARGVLALAASWLFVVLVTPSLTGSLACLSAVQAVGGLVLFLYACDVTGSGRLSAVFESSFWPLVLGLAGAGVTWAISAGIGAGQWWNVILSAVCGELAFGLLLCAIGFNPEERRRVRGFVDTLRNRLMPREKAVGA